VLSYPAGIAVSNHVLITLSDALRHRRRRPARRCCAGDRRQRLPRLGVPGPRNDDGPPTRNRRTPSLVGQPEGVNSAHARQRGRGNAPMRSSRRGGSSARSAAVRCAWPTSSRPSSCSSTLA